MDGVVDDDKKQFDAETTQDDDSQPDPEENLMLDQGNGRIWLVKVRKKYFQLCARKAFLRPSPLNLDSKVFDGTMVSYQC